MLKILTNLTHLHYVEKICHLFLLLLLLLHSHQNLIHWNFLKTKYKLVLYYKHILNNH